MTPVCFWGTPAPAVPALEALLDDENVDVLAVVTNPDRPAGRGYELQAPPVKQRAVAAGVPVWQPQKPREVLDELRGLAPAACAVVAYGALLPRDVLDAGGAGFVNLHFSLLPRWRGAAPVQHTLLAGDDVTGVTCFVLEEGMDTGPVLLRSEVAVEAHETAGELMDKLAVIGAPLLARAVTGLVDGSLEPEPQDDSQATYAPKLSSQDAALDWERPAVAIERAVRAFNPVPGAHTSLGGRRLKVHRAALAAEGDGAPGTVVGTDPEGRPVVACGQGAVSLLSVQPAGKQAMDGRDFANGYQPVGRQLGS